VRQRIAAVLALLAFAVCLVIGGLQTGNSFGTTVTRALGAMVVTLVIGLLIGAMAQRMLDENLNAHKPLPRTKNNANQPE
jgi:hypothetical protein